MSLTPFERLALCCLRPSPPATSDRTFDPRSVAPRADVSLIDGIFCLAPDLELRVQVGGTCAGNAVAQAIEIGHHLLRLPCPPVSGTGCWAQGQLWAAQRGGHVDPSSGAWVQRVLQAATEWGWASREEHPEDGLQELGAEALGEIVTRAQGPTTFEHEVIEAGFMGFLGFGEDYLDSIEAALRSGATIVTSGLVDEAFAAAEPGGIVDAVRGGGGHALAVDALRTGLSGERLWGIRDTWGRGVGQTKLVRRRLWGTDGFMRSRWEHRPTRVVLR